MSIDLKKTVAVLAGHCEIEEAETLLAWCLEHPKGKVNLKHLSHLHTAVLQVLMALNPPISYWPEDRDMAGWLQQTLELN